MPTLIFIDTKTWRYARYEKVTLRDSKGRILEKKLRCTDVIYADVDGPMDGEDVEIFRSNPSSVALITTSNPSP